MKKLLLYLSGIIVGTSLLAQVPQGISHQAVIRNAGNELVINSTIGVRVSILQGSATGEAVYVEIHAPQSNANGLITYVIGAGNAVDGQFSEIDWSDGPFYLKTEADPGGGTDYSISGVTQFLSVPYAMYAEESAGINEVFDLLNGVLEELDYLKNLAGVGTVTDIDGNTYRTIKIGNQSWMTENLRTTRYANGDNILTDLSDELWGNITIGAYAIYPHESVDGINSEEEMVEAYGKLYNWYAVDDDRGLCPEGWRVPSDDDWTQLVDYIGDQGFPNTNDVNGAGNALKSCRQDGSPLGSDCDTSEHPRWNSHGTHSGFDEFGFSALPGGRRWTDGSFHDLGVSGNWWSSTEYSSLSAWLLALRSFAGNVDPYPIMKLSGFSLRCVRDN